MRGERGRDLSEDLGDDDDEGESTDANCDNEELDYDDDEDDDEEEEEEEEEDDEDDDDDDDKEESSSSADGETEKGAKGLKKSVVPLSPGGREATAFRLQFLGSVEVEEEGKKNRKRLKKNMVEEAVARVKVCGALCVVDARLEIFRYAFYGSDQ